MNVVKVVDFDKIPHKVPFHELFENQWEGYLAVYFTQTERTILSRHLILSIELIKQLGPKWRDELAQASGPGIQLVAASANPGVDWYLTHPTKPVMVSVIPRKGEENWPGDEEVVGYLDRFFSRYAP